LGSAASPAGAGRARRLICRYTPTILLPVFVIGITGGLLSGLLGIGGAILLLPLLTTFAGLTLKEATNLTVVEVVASSLVGWLAIRRGGLVHPQLVLWMGSFAAVGSFAGGYVSERLTDLQLNVIFASVVLAALSLLFLPVRQRLVSGVDDSEGGTPGINVPFAAGLGALVGLLAGVLGAGGGFLIVPLMLTALRVPMRLAIGSSAVVKLIGSSSAYAGKLAGAHIDPTLASALVFGAVPCTYAGTWIAHRIPSRYVRALLVVTLAVVALRSVQVLVTSA
jgi:uncharacterized protein